MFPSIVRAFCVRVNARLLDVHCLLQAKSVCISADQQYQDHKIISPYKSPQTMHSILHE